MKHASFEPAFPMLAANERPAPIKTLTAPQLHVVLLAMRGPLKRIGRAWSGPDRERKLDPRTVVALIRLGLLYRPVPQSARLTLRGLWHARTLCSAIGAPSLSSPAQGVEA